MKVFVQGYSMTRAQEQINEVFKRHIVHYHIDSKIG